jgi:DNA-directed RNA polymerase specialized sigma24 family protein
MRVRRDVQLLELLPKQSPANDSPKKSWKGDLHAVKQGKLQFAVLAKRHRALMCAIARPWLGRCPPNVGLEDLAQEILLEVWQAIEVWDSERGTPLLNYVRGRIRHRMLAFTHKLIRGSEKDGRYLLQQIIEEKVVKVYGAGEHPEQLDFVPVTLPVDDDCDVAQLAALVVGGLPSKQARVVAGLLTGEQTDSVTERVYGSKCKLQRKAALRAFAAATALVHSSGEPEENGQRTKETHAHQSTTCSRSKENFSAAGSSRQQATCASHLGQG